MGGSQRFHHRERSEETTAPNSFSARDRLTVDETTYEVFRLERVEGALRLPYSLTA